MMHLEQTLLRMAMGSYAVSLVACVLGFAGKSERAGKAARVMALLGLALQSAMLVMRGVRAGHVPLVSMYEFLGAFAWMVVLAYLIFEWRSAEAGEWTQAVGGLALVLALGLLSYAANLPAQMKQTEMLMPVLKSNWLVFHVATAVIGYAAAGLASALACLYFLSPRSGSADGWLGRRLPSSSAIDRAVYRSVRFAFLFLTLLNVTGAVWAYDAWGRYWGWDPKETWSLITWVVYVFYLHARLRANWPAPRLNAIVLIGLATIMFTFLGVNQLAAFSESLHSYASGS